MCSSDLQFFFFVFFFNDTATTEIYTLSLHDALPILIVVGAGTSGMMAAISAAEQGARVLLIEKNKKAGKKLLMTGRSEEHTSELQSRKRISYAVFCLKKKKKQKKNKKKKRK